MAVLVVASIKGGAGKTTLAVNLAATLDQDGSDVLFIDTDDQKTGMIYSQLRANLQGDSGFTAIHLSGQSVRDQVKKQRSKYDQIIIDVGGRNTDTLQYALLVADTVLIPVQPRGADIWSLELIVEEINKVKAVNENLRAIVALNMADPGQSQDNRDAIEVIKEMEGINLAKTIIVRRKAFANSLGTGRMISELMPVDDKAISEFLKLREEVYSQE